MKVPEELRKAAGEEELFLALMRGIYMVLTFAERAFRGAKAKVSTQHTGVSIFAD